MNHGVQTQLSALQQGNRQLQFIVDALPVPVAYVDADQRYRFSNRSYRAWLGASGDDLSGRHLREVLGEPAYLAIRQQVEAALAGQQVTFESPASSKEGRPRHLRATYIPDLDEAGQARGFVSLVCDVTDQKQAEDALRDREEMLRLALPNSPDFMFHQDRDLRYTWVVNRARVDADRLLGKTDFQLLEAEQAGTLTSLKRRVLETGLARSAEIVVTIGGSDHRFDVVVQPRRDRDGQIVGIAGYAHDITERERLEERIRRAERLESVARMAAQVAHDFNTLLAPLAAYPGLIKMKLPPHHPAARYCDVMAESVQQMASINADMMALGAGGEPQREPTDLNELIRSVVGLVPDFPDTLTIQLDLAPDPVPVRGSPTQLLRLVTNLLANAREAVDDAGPIQIKTESVYVDQPLVGHDRIEIGEYARLSITDAGCGIPPEIQDKIFEAFFTTRRGIKRPGSGLGLTIVQAIVRDHGGYLDLLSEVGKGTTFSIYLPLCRDALQSKPRGGVQGGTESILVVDDDELQLAVTSEILARLGYRIETVRSGEEAVARLKERPADLLILDMIMPPGMDGVETYRRALELWPTQRALTTSGKPVSDLVHQAQALGAGAHIRKPMTLEMLGRSVRQELDRHHVA